MILYSVLVGFSVFVILATLCAYKIHARIALSQGINPDEVVHGHLEEKDPHEVLLEIIEHLELVLYAKD